MKQLFQTPAYLLFCLLLLFQCAGGRENQESTMDARPVNTIEAGGRLIPVYSSFSDIQPIFEKSNDTTYVINFWATWCKPCVEELPYFESLIEKYDGEKLRVILVSLDFERDLRTTLVDFVKSRQIKSDIMVLLDGNYNEWIDKVDPEWGGAIPVTVIYNGKKREFVGRQLPDFEELQEIVRRVL